MVTVSISTQSDKLRANAENRFLAMGFRPFFVGGVCVALFNVILWVLIYSGRLSYQLTAVPALYWHAHEMIYGFTSAIIAGFLLTAVPRWTEQPYLSGARLAALFLLWIAARLALFAGESGLLLASLLNSSFLFSLSYLLFQPIARSRRWQHSAVIGKVVFLMLGSCLFYLGALQIYPAGLSIGVYLGFYTVVGLILTILRRVLPAFIEAAAKDNVLLRRNTFLDRSSLILLVLFIISVVFYRSSGIHQLLALPLALVHARRCADWYHGSIWQNVLVWSLYISYCIFPIGFLLLFLSYFSIINGFLALHTFAFGAIGFVILSMMCRVTLGHGGGRVFDPPRGTSSIFYLLVMGIVFRIVVPIFKPDIYIFAVATAAIFWSAALILYLYIYRLYLLPGLFSSKVNSGGR